jgi:hypothetical protein
MPTETISIDLPVPLKQELERLSRERSEAGKPTTLHEIVIAAVLVYLEDQEDISAHNAALAEPGDSIPLAQILEEFGADLPKHV